MSQNLQRCTKLTKKILIERKKATGIPMAQLMEYAVINMPYVSAKEIKDDVKRKKRQLP